MQSDQGLHYLPTLSTLAAYKDKMTKYKGICKKGHSLLFLFQFLFTVFMFFFCFFFFLMPPKELQMAY